MTRRLLTLVALAIAFGAFICSDPPPAAPRVHTIGLIEHRGQFYRFEDLMNPEFRAASDDPFVKSFAEQKHFAEPWAGKGNPRKNLADLHMHHQEIWRSERLTSDIHDIEALQKSLPARMPWAGMNAPGDE